MIGPWNEAEPPEMPKPTILQWLRFAIRAGAAVVATGILLLFVLLFQLIEKVWPIGIAHRIVRLWARICLWLSGVGLRVHGQPMPHGGAMVANHGSWLDILTMFSAGDVHFVAKSEVAKWPVIGWLARQVGTLFIERRRSQAGTHQAVLRKRLVEGVRLCFFPEGTSTDTLRVLPFRSTLFAAFLTEDLADLMWIQPTTLVYTVPDGQAPQFYGWWGEMEIGPHLVSTLALSSGGWVDVYFHEPVKASDFADRKALALHCENEVRQGFERNAPKQLVT